MGPHAHVVPQEAKGLRHRSDECLGFESSKPSCSLSSAASAAFSCRAASSACSSCSGPGCTDEDDEVIRVPNGKQDRLARRSISFAHLLGSFLYGHCISKRCRRAAGPHVTLVPFLDRAERDVGQQRREDAALGGAGFARKNCSSARTPALRNATTSRFTFASADAAANPDHQRVMVDVVEACLDVPFDGPLVREPAFGFRPARPSDAGAFEVLQRSVDRLARPEAVRDGIEIRLENRLQDVLHRCLYDPVFHGGNAEGAKLPSAVPPSG